MTASGEESVQRMVEEHETAEEVSGDSSKKDSLAGVGSQVPAALRQAS